MACVVNWQCGLLEMESAKALVLLILSSVRKGALQEVSTITQKCSWHRAGDRMFLEKLIRKPRWLVCPESPRPWNWSVSGSHPDKYGHECHFW